MHLPRSGMGVESESLRRPDRRMAHKRRDVATMIQGLTGPAARSANVPPAADDYGWLATAGPALRSWRAAASAEAPSVAGSRRPTAVPLLHGGGRMLRRLRVHRCALCRRLGRRGFERGGRGWTCSDRTACATRRRRRSSGRARRADLLWADLLWGDPRWARALLPSDDRERNAPSQRLGQLAERSFPPGPMPLDPTRPGGPPLAELHGQRNWRCLSAGLSAATLLVGIATLITILVK
jgi:hypothetical protein